MSGPVSVGIPGPVTVSIPELVSIAVLEPVPAGFSGLFIVEEPIITRNKGNDTTVTKKYC